MFNKKYLAADIGSRYIKLVFGAVNKGKIEISEYDIIDTPANTIKDGKIINSRLLASVISESLKKNRIKAKKLILSVTGTGVITRDIQIPKSTEHEIENMLEFEAQQYFPVNLENYVLDFKVIEEIINPDGTYNRILLVAVPTKQVEEYMKLPALLKMEIADITIPANCVFKFLFGRDNEIENPYVPREFAVLDIGCETTGVCIFHDRKLKFNRILLNGSSDIDKLISSEFSMDFKHAEDTKIGRAKIVSEDIEFDETDETLSLSSVIRPAVNNLINDVNRFFEFYNSRSAGNRLERIYICGGGSKLSGLSKYISSYFNIPVEYLNMKNNVVYKGKKKPEQYEADFVLLINTIGAVMH